jgi:hypothetical protein
MAGVLATEAELLVAAGVVATSLRRQAGASTALVCVWRGHGEPPLPAPAPGGPAASRLANKLTGRGLPARACGALCVAELPAEPGAAVAAFRDGLAAADGPAVLALARRDPAFDVLLAGADRLVLGATEGADDALTELALAGLLALNPRAARVSLPGTLVARHAARLGFAPAPSRSEAPRDLPARAVQEQLS